MEKMENTHENQNQVTAQGADLTEVMTMFDDYENKSDDKPKQSKEDILKRYFTPRNSVENFRILPPLAGRKIVEKAFFHYVPVNKAVAGGKGWRKVYCPSHNSAKVAKLDSAGSVIKDAGGNPVLIPQPCPLCAEANRIKKGLDTSVKYIKKDAMTPAQLVIREKNSAIYKEAGKWEAREYSIVRGIDKGMPKDGVKYWRFKDNFKNQGILDKLVPALKLFHEQHGHNPTDVNSGCDLYINVVDSKMPNGNTFKDVSSVTAKNPTKLYEDDIVVKQWLSDQTTWRDVFKEASMTKVLESPEYLTRIVKGTDPYWDARDEENKRYVFPDPADAELMAQANEKSESLDADSDAEFGMASDVVGDAYSVNIANVSTEDVGTFKDDAVNVGAEFTPVVETPVVETPVVETPVVETPVVETPVVETASVETPPKPEDYDDLPF